MRRECELLSNEKRARWLLSKSAGMKTDFEAGPALRRILSDEALDPKDFKTDFQMERVVRRVCAVAHSNPELVRRLLTLMMNEPNYLAERMMYLALTTKCSASVDLLLGLGWKPLSCVELRWESLERRRQNALLLRAAIFAGRSDLLALVPQGKLCSRYFFHHTSCDVSQVPTCPCEMSSSHLRLLLRSEDPLTVLASLRPNDVRRLVGTTRCPFMGELITFDYAEGLYALASVIPWVRKEVLSITNNDETHPVFVDLMQGL